MERRITVTELQDVLSSMRKRSIEEGFMSEMPITKKIEFFDAKPSFGGAPIKRKDLEFIIQCRLTETESN